jgi:hypothetical protein
MKREMLHQQLAFLNGFGFPYIPFDEQLRRCQRYYHSTYDYGVARGTTTFAGMVEFFAAAATVARGFAPFPVTMRAVPTVTPYSPQTGASGSGTDFTAGTDVALSAIIASAEAISQWTTAVCRRRL